MNSINLIGNVVADPKIFDNEGKTKTALLTIAVNDLRASKSGGVHTDFIPLVTFGKTAELVEQYVKKGNKLGITGRLSVKNVKEEGTYVNSFNVIVDQVQFLTPKKVEE